jgi:hypothetical protein
MAIGQIPMTLFGHMIGMMISLFQGPTHQVAAIIHNMHTLCTTIYINSQYAQTHYNGEKTEIVYGHR